MKKKTLRGDANTARWPGAAESWGPGGQLPPLFQVCGPLMVLDPSLFAVFTCAQSVAVVIHSFMYSVIVVQLTTDNDSSKRSEVEVE